MYSNISPFFTKTIALVHIAPSAQQQVTTQGVLQRSGQVLVKDAVQIIVVRAQITIQLRA